LVAPRRFVLLAAASLCVGGVEAAALSLSRRRVNRRVSVLTGEQVVQILDETVDWYRTLEPSSKMPPASDLLILFCQSTDGDKVVPGWPSTSLGECRTPQQ